MVSQGPAQAQPSFVSYLVLKDAFVQIWGLILIALSDGSQSIYKGCTDVRAQPLVMACIVEVPPAQTISHLVFAQKLVARPAMSSEQ